MISAIDILLANLFLNVIRSVSKSKGRHSGLENSTDSPNAFVSLL